jgi:hypothetical protein
MHTIQSSTYPPGGGGDNTNSKNIYTFAVEIQKDKDMDTTFHFTSAQEVTPAILDVIRQVYQKNLFLFISGKRNRLYPTGKYRK